MCYICVWGEVRGLRGAWSPCLPLASDGWAGAGVKAYVHQLLLRVILLCAVCPVAVGLIDDHLGLLLTVISVQVFLEIGQLLLGEGKTTST